MGGSYFASNTLLSITAAIPPAATLAVFAHLFKKDNSKATAAVNAALKIAN
jgi:hypothetical protein